MNEFLSNLAQVGLTLLVLTMMFIWIIGNFDVHISITKRENNKTKTTDSSSKHIDKQQRKSETK